MWRAYRAPRKNGRGVPTKEGHGMPCSYTRPRDGDVKSPPQSIGLASAKSLSLKKAGPCKGEMQASLKESGHKIAEGPTLLRRKRDSSRKDHAMAQSTSTPQADAFEGTKTEEKAGQLRSK